MGDFRSGAVVRWDQKRGEYIMPIFTLRCTYRFRLATLPHPSPAEGTPMLEEVNSTCLRYLVATLDSSFP